MYHKYHKYHKLIRFISVTILPVVLLVPVVLVVPPSRVSAQSPTLMVTATPTISEEEVKNSIQERLKKAAQEKGEAADQVLGAKNKLAVVGKLSDVSNNTLTIRARGETNELVTTDNETTFVRNGKAAKREDIQIGDWIIAMGYRGGKGNSVVVAKRVVAKDKPTEYPKRVSVIGKVTSDKFQVTSDKKTFKIEAAGDKTEVFTVTVTAKSKIATGDIQAEKKVVLIGEPDKNDATKLTIKAIKVL